MVARNRKYRVNAVSIGVRKYYPLCEVKPNTIVTALEPAPNGGLDVIDVKTSTGRIKSVYAFQLKPK